VQAPIENNVKLKGLGEWLKWYSTCLASTGPELKPKKKKKSIFVHLILNITP
jgi:hypothetical protein